MTLQNSMDERKLKNYQAFDHTLLSSMTVRVSRAGPVCVCVVWSEWVGGIGLSFKFDREREREISQPQDTHTLTHIRPTHIINTEINTIY